MPEVVKDMIDSEEQLGVGNIIYEFYQRYNILYLMLASFSIVYNCTHV